MKWGELQSVIQLAVAVNTIYFSLRDIRATAEQREQNAIDAISAKVKVLPQPSSPSALAVYTELRASLTDLVVNFQNKVADLDKYDTHVKRFCLLVIFVFTAVLIYSSFYYNSEINNQLAFSLSIFGFSPICAGLGLNISFVRKLRAQTMRMRHDVERQIIKL